ncbi:MAG TPA: M14 family metallopeptidase [Pirellulaceae bacterium]|nr:M14 family metallopeptidase [Pirellulaceae bacterium]HMO91938.1 M14 family metallopeptidase [Pirellulaceae bacterium]HMP68737.1 M14 family metallopeptidase [Pirellulaceae bacterium]
MLTFRLIGKMRDAIARRVCIDTVVFVVALFIFAGHTANIDAQLRLTRDQVPLQKMPIQELIPLPEVVANPAIPDSQQMLGHGWGQEISSYAQINEYLKALTQAAPDRCRLVRYGETYEGRDLHYLVISSPENITRLEEIRTNNLRLADPRAIAFQQAETMIDESPVIVWLGYAVHGNEVTPSDAALLTAYHLLADQRTSTHELLKNIVVIIDPLQNPDGRERFVNVFRETRGRFIQTDPIANEHTERWPGGRTNHYWIDMNRDWFLQSQREVRAKVAAYLEWQPQLFVDAHEMGHNSSFYFPPPSDPKNPFLTPIQFDWLGKLGKHHGEWFDRFKFAYMTREVFDAFFPGYGSEWPTLQGGLGILWEQAGPRGLLIDKNDETQLSYGDGVRHQYISALAVLEFAARHRGELLRTFHANRMRGIRLGEDGDVTDFFLLTNDRPQRSLRLAEILQRNGIEIHRIDETIELECRSSHDTESKSRTVPAGSFHIRVAQPSGMILRALLDREVEMDGKFLRRQLELNQLRLPDEIYDVTAWSLPLAFDVQCLATRTTQKIPSTLIDVNTVGLPDAFGMASVAYLIPGTDGGVQLIAGMIRDGFRVHVANESFKIAGRTFDRGTFIVKVFENDASLHERLTRDSEAFRVEIIPTDSSYVEEGVHMGGPNVKWIRPPRILLVVNEPTFYSSGHTWFLFDQYLEYPTTRVKGADFSRADLSKFNTIILPDGNYSENSGFGAATAKTLLDWVSKGGTLITLRGATSWAAQEDNELLKNKLVNRKIIVETKDEAQNTTEKVPPDSVPGAFFRTEVFQQHWVTFHCRPELHAFYTGRIILTPTPETAGRSLVTFSDADRLLTSGFCWPESLQLLEKTPLVVYRSVGSGHIIAFTDDPNYRAMFPSLQRLFINAAMLGAGQ